MENFEFKWIKAELYNPQTHDYEAEGRFAYIAKDDNISSDDLIEVFEDIIARCNITDYFTFSSVIEDEFVTRPAALVNDECGFLGGIAGAYSQSLDLKDAWDKICKLQGYKARLDNIYYFERLLKNVRLRCLQLKEIPQMLD